MSYQVDKRGFYGEFGGAYIPEILQKNITDLQNNYKKIIQDPDFQAEFQNLLCDYAGRSTALFYATRLSEHYQSKIYLKREDLLHTGAHKINNCLGQILLAKKLGKKRIIAETGAGQHGVATATVCALKNMQCVVYMGEVDTKRQKVNVEKMKILGAEVRPVYSGSRTLKDATNEAIRDWINNPEDTHYIIGSVVGPHPYPDMVTQFQSVISKEIEKQLQEKEQGKDPNSIIACVGGGSNAIGGFYHYLEKKQTRLIAVEASGLGINSGKSAATTVLGKMGILHGSKTLLMQTADGQVQEPYSLSAGLDYPGISPIHAHLHKSKRAEFYHCTDKEALDAVKLLSKLEGIIPALESAHALAVFEKIKFLPEDINILILSGRGDKDLDTYLKHFSNE
jgi:tryptophan synthase beta chain